MSSLSWKGVMVLHMKTGVEQSVYATVLLHLLPDRAVLPGEAISRQLGVSPTYFQKLLRKLVNAGVIVSVPGVKGGFKLKKKAEEITVYDIYTAIEGVRSLYEPNGVFGAMLELEEDFPCCIVEDLMKEAEEAWIGIMQQETVASLAGKLDQQRFQQHTENLKSWINEQITN